MGLLGVIRASCETSSIRCLPKLVRAKTLIQKTLWMFSLTIGLSVASYEVYKLLDTFLAHQTSLSVSTDEGYTMFIDSHFLC